VPKLNLSDEAGVLLLKMIRYRTDLNKDEELVRVEVMDQLIPEYPDLDLSLAKTFEPHMKIAQAMAINPRAAEIFASFHLGGCSHCAISEKETIEQVCLAYGVQIEALMGALNSLLEIKTGDSNEREESNQGKL